MAEVHAQQNPVDYWQQFHSGVQHWMVSAGADEQALDAASSALDSWACNYPDQAPEVGMLALSGCYAANEYAASGAVVRLAHIGLEAALLLPAFSSDDHAANALLAALAADAHLDLNEPSAGQEMLECAEAAIGQVDPVLSAYLGIHLNTVRAAFAEAALEDATAAVQYERALADGTPLLQSGANLRDLKRVWIPLVFGTGLELFEDGADMADALLAGDIQRVFTRAALGLARTTAHDQQDAAHQAVDACLRYGFPAGAPTLDLRRCLTLLPAGERDSAIEKLLGVATHLQGEDLRAAWQVLLLSTHSSLLQADGASAAAALARARCAEPLWRCSDALTLAIAMADLLPQNVTTGGAAISGTVAGFLEAYGPLARALRGSPLELRVRAHFEGPLAAATALAFDEVARHPSTDARCLLAVLLDALRAPGAEPPADSSEPETLRHGFAAAADRLRRLCTAVEAVGDATAILLQTVEDQVLVICATGDAAEPLVLARAESAYPAAAQKLASSLRTAVKHSDDSEAGQEELMRRGHAAFAALPRQIRHVLRSRRVVYIVTDFWSDREGVPFELLHDGTAFLGLTRLIARALSLRDLVRTVEADPIPVPVPRRALCAAAPHAADLPPLKLAEDEVDLVRGKLAKRHWEAPSVPEEALTPQLLVDAIELAGITHVAAHGRTWAGGEALVLPRGRYLTVRDIEWHPRRLQSFVFLSACSLGQVRYLGGGLSQGIPFALSRAGVPAVVANFHSIEDASASLLATEFYGHSTSEPIGEALRRARVSLDARGASPRLWATMILVGDPLYRLAHGKIRRPEPAAALLAAFTSLDSADQIRADAFKEARNALRTRPRDARLDGAMTWVLAASELEESPEARRFDAAARLARELGCPAGEALMRFALAQQEPEGPPAKLQGRLDALINILEPLAAAGNQWRRLYEGSLTRRRRLDVSDPGAFTVGSVTVNDSSDPVVAAFFDLQHAMDQQSARQYGQLLRHHEQSLDDVAWNAVVLGRESRFAFWTSQAAASTQLGKRLAAMSDLSTLTSQHARRIACGLLPFLWDTQRVTHLDRELAIKQAATLRLAVTSVPTTWVGSALAERCGTFGDRIDNIRRLLPTPTDGDGASRFASALSALDSPTAVEDELESLRHDMKAAVAESLATSPELGANVAAWLLGMILEESHAAARFGCRPTEMSLRLLYEGLIDEAEMWFGHYRRAGDEASRAAAPTIMEIWRREVGH